MTRSRLPAGYPPKAGGSSQLSPRSAIAWEFWRRHRWGFRALGLYLILAAAGLFLMPQPFSLGVLFLYVAYFAILTGYVAVRFVRHARRSSGVTSRRMQAQVDGLMLLARVEDDELPTGSYDMKALVEEALEPACQHRRYDLCPACCKRYLRDPFGKDIAQKFDFSEN